MDSRLKNWLLGGAVHLFVDLALIAVLAISLAYWTWVAFTPRVIGASALSAETRTQEAGAIAARHLFGGGSSVALADAAPASSLRLVGVVAPVRAVFALENGKSRTAAVGEAISGEAVLKEVHPDYVLVSRGGAVERLKLERRAAGR
jgi:general secretion pathway protein C